MSAFIKFSKTKKKKRNKRKEESNKKRQIQKKIREGKSLCTIIQHSLFPCYNRQITDIWFHLPKFKVDAL